MTLPHPDTLRGSLRAQRCVPRKPNEEELLQIGAVVARCSQPDSGSISDPDLEMLTQFGFELSAYRTLFAEAQRGNPSRLSAFLESAGFSRLARELNGTTSTVPSVTAYIPCFNGAEFIEAAVRSLKQQSYPIAEILVVDDGSTDDSADSAARAGVTVIRHPENRGLGAARNSALAAATGEYLAGIDADVEAHPLWLEQLMQKVQAEPSTVAGGRLIERNAASIPDSWRARIMKQHHGQGPTRGMVVFGCNSVGRTDLIRAIGGYSSQYLKSFEDVDFTNRLLQSGRSTAYLPDALAWHARKDSLESVLKTAFNWRSPPFDSRGARTDLKVLLSKWSVTIQGDLEELRFLIQENRTELLPISFMHSLYGLAFDLARFQGGSAAEAEAIRRGGTALLLRASRRITRAGPETTRLMERVLAEFSREAGVPADLSLDGTSEQVLACAAPAIPREAASLLSLGLGELHAVLDYEPALHQKIEAGARYLVEREHSSPFTVRFPGDFADGDSCSFGAALDPFDWVEMIVGSNPSAIALDLKGGDPTEKAYWLLKLFERSCGLSLRLHGEPTDVVSRVLELALRQP